MRLAWRFLIGGLIAGLAVWLVIGAVRGIHSPWEGLYGVLLIAPILLVWALVGRYAWQGARAVSAAKALLALAAGGEKALGPTGQDEAERLMATIQRGLNAFSRDALRDILRGGLATQGPLRGTILVACCLVSNGPDEALEQALAELGSIQRRDQLLILMDWLLVNGVGDVIGRLHELVGQAPPECRVDVVAGLLMSIDMDEPEEWRPMAPYSSELETLTREGSYFKQERAKKLLAVLDTNGSPS